MKRHPAIPQRKAPQAEVISSLSATLSIARSGAHPVRFPFA
jgi:hypothetical protein